METQPMTTDHPVPQQTARPQDIAQPPVPRVQPTEYEVCYLTEDDINSLAFTLTVRYRGEGRWAVQRGEHSCLGADGKWAQGIKEYDRGKTWLDAHRFDLDTALRLAKAAARAVTVNGYTVADALAMYERDTAGGEQA
jgi:hypothetical protein